MTVSIERCCILVLGMHRSGTSALTRVLGLLGAQMPKHTVPAGQDNERGFWEPAELPGLNDKWLVALGSAYDDWRPIRLSELDPDILSKWKQQLTRLLQDEFASAQLFPVKDPRICRFAPLVLETLCELGIAPRIVIPFRNPLDVAASLNLRNGFSQEKSVLLWLRHVLDAEAASREYSRAFLDYNRLLNDWRGAAASVSRHLRLDWPRGASEVAAEIEEFLAPSLRHHHHHTTELEVVGPRPWVRDAFHALLAMEESPDDSAALHEFDRIRGEFEAAVEVFGPEIARISAEHERIAEARAARITALESELENERQQGQTARQQADERATRLLDLGQKLDSVSARAAELERLNEQHAEKFVSVEQELAKVPERDEQYEGIVERCQGEILDLRTQLENEGAALMEARAEAKAAVDRAAEWERIAVDRQQSMDRLNHKLLGMKKQARRLMRSTSQQEAKLTELQAELSSARQAIESMESTANEREAKLAQLQEDLAAKQAHLSEVETLAEERSARITELQNELENQRAATEKAQGEVAAERINMEQLKRRNRSSRWLFRQLWDKIIHAPRDISRRVRRRKQRQSRKDHYQLIANSELFDQKWYLSQNPDVAEAGVDPVWHYLHYGGFEGRAPGPCFDSALYLQQRPDLSATRINPLAHYALHQRVGISLPAEIAVEQYSITQILSISRIINDKRARKFITSRVILLFKPILPISLKRRLRRRMMKNKPPLFKNELTFQQYVRKNSTSTLNTDWHISYGRLQRQDFDGAILLTVSVVTYNSIKWLPKFFDSLERQAYPNSWINLIVVDHGSTDDTVRFLRDYHERKSNRFSSFQILEQENYGFGAGHDLAFTLSSDDFVLVTNVDLEFHKESITRIVSLARNDREDVAAWELRQTPYEHPKYYDPITLEASWNSHACILIRRSAYISVGGYEKAIFMYGEDVELSYRFRGAGFRVRYIPKATVTHHVDFSEDTSRPHQLSGSLAANILLRYRYGSAMDVAEANNLYNELESNTSQSTSRKASINAALRTIDSKRKYFQNTRRPAYRVPFPFNKFDYELRRPGHDVPTPALCSTTLKPLVTVITRVHGRNQHMLSECIASVLNQTYQNIEHIIVEDRTDYSRALVAQVSNNYQTNIRFLNSAKGGRSAAANLALQSCSGDLIMFLDYDDLLFSDHIETLYCHMEAHDAASACFSLSWEVLTSRVNECSYDEIDYVLHMTPTATFCREILDEKNVFPIQSVLFKRELYDEFGGFHEDLSFLEDWNLWFRYSRQATFIGVPKLTSMFRTPYEREKRVERQRQLDLAYQSVKKRNQEDAKCLQGRSFQRAHPPSHLFTFRN